MSYCVYVCDVETTGTDFNKHDIIEICLRRISEPESKLWRLKPSRVENIEQEALKVNGHKLEDLLHKTVYGRETYLNPVDIIPEIEEWFLSDGCSADERVFVGHNPTFDYDFLVDMWKRHGMGDTFPFGFWTKDGKNLGYLLDTIQVARFIDLLVGKKRTRYNLGSLVKNYGITKSTAHRADGDVKMTTDLLIKMMEPFQEIAKEKFSEFYDE